MLHFWKKKWQKYVAGFLTAALIVTSTPAPYAFGAGDGQTQSGILAGLKPGEIGWDKTAVATDEEGVYKLTLQAGGVPLQSSADVVLVIDNSGSMDDNKKG